MKYQKKSPFKRQYIEKSPNIRQNVSVFIRLIRFALIMTGLLGVLLWGLSSTYLKLDDVSLTGLSNDTAYLDTPLIQHLLQQATHQAYFLTWDKIPLQQQIETLPWVKHAKIQVIFPNKVRLALTRQQAVAKYSVMATMPLHQQWTQQALSIAFVDTRTNHLLNETGHLFLPPKVTYPLNLVQLAGPANKTQQLLQQYQIYQAILDTYQLQVMLLYYDPYHMWHMRIRATGDDTEILLHLGDYTNEQGVVRFAKLYQKALKQRAPHVAEVDLRYSNGVAVQWQ